MGRGGFERREFICHSRGRSRKMKVPHTSSRGRHPHGQKQVREIRGRLQKGDRCHGPGVFQLTAGFPLAPGLARLSAVPRTPTGCRQGPGAGRMMSFRDKLLSRTAAAVACYLGHAPMVPGPQGRPAAGCCSQQYGDTGRPPRRPRPAAPCRAKAAACSAGAGVETARLTPGAGQR